MSPLYAVILFRFFSFTFLIHQYMLSFFKFCLFTSAFLFCHCISPFYFATVFRLFISPIFFRPFYFISPSFFALLFYFAILFRPLFYFAILFRPLFYFAILFALLFCLFYLYFQMQTRFRISISGFHLNIFSHTRMNTPHNNTTYFSLLMSTWSPTTLHTTHDSCDSRLTSHLF